MKLLGIDTSTMYLSVCISDGESALDFTHTLTHERPSTNLMQAIDDLLKKTKLKLRDIDGLCVNKGPGSFTGLRVAIAAVKALSLSMEKPVIGIPALDIIAENFSDVDGKLCVVVDAKRENLYTASYTVKKGLARRTKSSRISKIDEMLAGLKGEVLFAGDGIELCREKIISRKEISSSFADKERWFPKADRLCKLAYREFKKGKHDDPDKLAPMYLYPKECTITKRKP